MLKKQLLFIFSVISLCLFSLTSMAGAQQTDTLRYGSPMVGYVDKTAGLQEYHVINGTPTGKALLMGKSGIITMDVIPDSANYTTRQAAEIIRDGFIKGSFPEDRLSLTETTVNNFPATRLEARFADGGIIDGYFVKTNNRIYFQSIEGTAADLEPLSKILNTWNPDK